MNSGSRLRINACCITLFYYDTIVFYFFSLPKTGGDEGERPPVPTPSLSRALITAIWKHESRFPFLPFSPLFLLSTSSNLVNAYSIMQKWVYRYISNSPFLFLTRWHNAAPKPLCGWIPKVEVYQQQGNQPFILSVYPGVKEIEHLQMIAAYFHFSSKWLTVTISLCTIYNLPEGAIWRTVQQVGW